MTAPELARHIDQPTKRHRLVLLDTRRLRCLDCTQTVLLPTPAGSTSTSSGSPIPGPGEPRCPHHEHEHAAGCRTCAADAKAQADDAPPMVHRPTADVAARAAEVRAVLAPRAPEPATRAPAVDPERMAAVRADLATRQVIPMPDPDELEGAPS